MEGQILSGVRVLDVTHYIAGPYCTKLLAGLGAEVVKVEKPGEGDGARRMGPFPGDRPDPEKSGLFLHLNTSKKSLTLNLKTATGVKIFKELVKKADILVENFEPRVMPSLELDYGRLEKLNPRLVMTSVSNFGQSGPYRDFRAEELVAHALSGLMYTTGEPDREPLKTGGSLAQYVGGQAAFLATMIAFYQATLTGRGQHVDVSIAEANTDLMEAAMMADATRKLMREGNRHRGNYPWELYPCKDGYVAVMAGPGEWKGMAELMGKPELLNPRFEDKNSRRQYREEVDVLMRPWLMTHTKEEICQAAQGRRFAFGPLYSTKEVLAYSQLKAREFFVEIEHPEAGRLSYPGAPFRLSRGSWRFERAPLLGDHNEEVYGEGLGYSREDLVRLRQRGII